MSFILFYFICFSSTEPKEFLDSLMSLSHLDNILFMHHPFSDLVYWLNVLSLLKAPSALFQITPALHFAPSHFVIRHSFLLKSSLTFYPQIFAPLLLHFIRLKRFLDRFFLSSVYIIHNSFLAIP